ncbi:uncharacterized protein BO66DRAFT_52052 [Aspergillus aculeatinus CBS 121060]|uniref:Uncharacterized protein n=1 Tax=Aspergillus aculeatinus CBS 121060 TaxID=1448322 RepID=A0ACD1HDN1_9EURO|nr:hypothetical protein BO66DRAFT_52052 [Aspergillus aculeatinus CBS 121060]RAH71549.1 hypothetical protein BO66DRAFT_52052 [Aspergillus aculeatinus CBS 121060]
MSHQGLPSCGGKNYTNDCLSTCRGRVGLCSSLGQCSMITYLGRRYQNNDLQVPRLPLSISHPGQLVTLSAIHDTILVGVSGRSRPLPFGSAILWGSLLVSVALALSQYFRAENRRSLNRITGGGGR